MLKIILDFIEAILKKYGMITLISFVTGILTMSYLSQDIINKLPFGNQNIYWAFITALFSWIIILSFLKHSWNKLIGAIYNNRSSKKYNDSENKEAKRQIHEMIDKFNADDRKRLYDFVKGGNQPLPFNKYTCYMEYGSLLQSELVNITEKQTKISEEMIISTTGEKTVGNIINTHVAKLKPNIYEMLCQLYAEDGRLGNFD